MKFTTPCPHSHPLGFPGVAFGKESTCQCRRYKRHRFDPWVGKIPCRRKWQCTPVHLPWKFHGQRSLVAKSLWNHRVRHDRVNTHTPPPPPPQFCILSTQWALLICQLWKIMLYYLFNHFWAFISLSPLF